MDGIYEALARARKPWPAQQRFSAARTVHGCQQGDSLIDVSTKNFGLFFVRGEWIQGANFSRALEDCFGVPVTRPEKRSRRFYELLAGLRVHWRFIID
jgi:hypothetical protein